MNNSKVSMSVSCNIDISPIPVTNTFGGLSLELNNIYKLDIYDVVLLVFFAYNFWAVLAGQEKKSSRNARKKCLKKCSQICPKKCTRNGKKMLVQEESMF